MFITDKESLVKFQQKYRVWQGIPSIEVTKKGRIFSAYYSGNTGERVGNFVVLTVSDDNGASFSEPIAVSYAGEKARCFDQSLWIDPLGRLWFAWTVRAFDDSVKVNMDKCYAVICDDPDAESLSWGEVRYLGYGIMLNKPTVLSTGEWIFPIAYWRIGAMAVHNPYGATSLAYRSVDNGQTFEVIGGTKAPNSSFDEHMFLEKEDGVLNCYLRTFSGLAEASSFDQGKHWTESKVSEIKGPGSRFFIRRLKSGRVLLINHYDFNDRNNLTALLSDDDGKTWKWKIMLDERKDVSYPDAKEDEDGYIHITYDRERGDERHSFEECYKDGREILYARIKEEDVIAGKIVSEKGLLKSIISKLGEYEGKENLFNEPDLYTDAELSNHILKNFRDKEIDKVFEFYPVKCINMGEKEWIKLDQLIEEFNAEKEDKVLSLARVITLIRSCSGVEEKKVPLIDLVKEYVDKNWQENFSMQEVSHAVNSSVFYIIHQFKKHMGITILEYRTAIRMRKAKEMLQNAENSISNIASECGFDDFSYFSKLFKKEEGCSPSEFRERFKK